MKQYVVTSNHYNGSLLFKYDEQALLIGFEIQAALSEEQRGYFFKHLPLHSKTLLVDWVKKSPTMRVIEMQPDLSFENFWNTYGRFYGSKVGDKTKCKKHWDKLSDADKTKALQNIQRYKQFCDTKGIDMVYAERYLSQDRFNNTF